MPIGVRLVTDIGKSRSSHGILHGVLLAHRGDHVAHSGAEENGSAEEVAARLEAPVAFRDSLLVHALEKNSHEIITTRRQEWREVTRPFGAAGLTSARERP